MILDKVSTYVYIIKFLKRDFSYAYILIMLHFKNHFFCVNEINVIINVKISNKRLYFNFYVIMIRYMFYNNYNQYVTFKIDIVLFYWDSNKNQYNKKFFKKFYDRIVFESDFEYLKYYRRRFLIISKNEFKQNC